VSQIVAAPHKLAQPLSPSAGESRSLRGQIFFLHAERFEDIAVEAN
jgi:hypothetical protein